MRVIAWHGLPAVIAGSVRRGASGAHRRPRRRWRSPVIAFVCAVLLALIPAAALAASQPTLTITLYDEWTVVVGGDHYPGGSDVHLTALLAFADGTSYAGAGTIPTNAAGHFLVGFVLPDYPGVAGQITVATTADGVAAQTATLPIGPGTLPQSPSPAPSQSKAPAVTVPQPNMGGGVGGDDAVDSCPSSGELSGAPGGNSFAGHSYNGHGQTLPRGNYTIGSNTCVENYVFDGSNLTLSGVPSNVTVVNNLFQNWPAKQAIANVNGTNVNINYNTVKNTSGGAWTGIFGQGMFNNVTVSHNDIGSIGAAVDGIQLRFTGTGTNVDVSYNRITDNGRFPIELQQVVHGLKVMHNYVTVRAQGANTGGQISVAVGNDKDGGGYYDSDTSGVEVAYNIILNKDSGATGACLENRGNGNVLHNNYCSNFQFINDYAMTNNSQPTPWHVTDNILLGPGGGTFSTYEGFNRSGYAPVAPTETGNQRFSVGDPKAPGVPGWPYKVGMQN